MNRNDVVGLVIAGLDEILSEICKQQRIEMPHFEESTHLIGRRSVLDSLGLVTLIVNIEQKLSEEYGIEVALADERAMSQEKSPFRTLGSLSDYISLLIEEQTQHVAS